MPKLKSNRGAKKRFRISARGKVKHKRAYLRHILTSKGTHQKRHLRKAGLLPKAEAQMVKRLLPYG